MTGAYHSGDDRFQRDRTKQNALIAAGWRVLRFTWIDISDRPAYVLAQVGHLLAA
jgi:very-short-patch-repair endonuclease